MMQDKKRKYDLEDRMVEFSIKIIDIVEKLPNTKAGNHLAGQLIRSGTSPTFNYGEAESAESINDFIHKMSICLKELRETRLCLIIIKRKPLIEDIPLVDITLKENQELISIFGKSINTAEKNKKKK
ncbi:MAG: four helix bundle protein [Ignavibacteriales bacterium]|nr:MAG: four helix bundle protein [Ignavibacteriales bacterium]